MFALLAIPAALHAQAIPGALPESAKALAQGEWPTYAGTASARYSPLTQIDATNARRLHIAWRWKSPDMAIKEADPAVGPSTANESTPLMVGGVLYTPRCPRSPPSTPPPVRPNGCSIPRSTKMVSVPNLGWVHRGVAYWRNGDDERIVMLTAFGQMIAIDAKTGTPVPAFGKDGRVDLVEGLRQGSYDFIGLPSYVPGPRGLPLLKPPFGSMVAIDMNGGDHRWRIPIGRSGAMGSIQKLGIREQLGLPFRSWALLTKTVMIVVQMGYYGPQRFVPGLNLPIRDLHNLDPHLWVYDKLSGEMLADLALPANATGAPMTYMAGGKQYIVFPVGGGPLVEELIAVAL